MVEVIEGRMGGKQRLAVGVDCGMVAVMVMAQVTDPEQRDLGQLFYILHLLWIDELVPVDPVPEFFQQIQPKDSRLG